MRAFGKAVDAARKTSPGSRAFDIGCGTGNVVALLRRRGYSVAGIDISPAVVLDTARRFASDSAVEIMAIAVEDLPFGPAEFDLITSVTVLQHIMDDAKLQAAMRALLKSLKPGGTLIALEIAPAWRMSPSKVQAGVVERTAVEWRELFVSTGWRVDAERRYAPWGPVMVHQFDRLVGKLTGWTKKSNFPPETVSSSIGEQVTPANRRGRLYRSCSAIFRCVRRGILASAWPFDHLLRVPGPSHFAYYRTFWLRPA